MCDDCYFEEYFPDENKARVIGLPLYSEADWQMLNEIDKSDSADYAEWFNNRDNLKKSFEAKGMRVIDVTINTAQMQKYFEANGLENNSENRAAYVTDKLIEENDRN